MFKYAKKNAATAALDKKDAAPEKKRAQMLFANYIQDSSHIYVRASYAPLVYSMKMGNTNKVCAYCPLKHNGARQALEQSDEVMLKCSLHGFNLPANLIKISVKQDNTLKVYDADQYDLDRMKEEDKKKWRADFIKMHNREPTNIFNPIETNMIIPRCENCKSVKFGRSTTEASRGRYYVSCAGCGIKKVDFKCYLLDVTKKHATDLLAKVQANPAEYKTKISIKEIETFLKKMFDSQNESLNLRLDNSSSQDVAEFEESVFDEDEIAKQDAGVDNALLFVEKFFNFENYVIITIKYFMAYLEVIREREKASSSNTTVSNDSVTAKSSSNNNTIQEDIEDDDDAELEIVPSKKIKL